MLGDGTSADKGWCCSLGKLGDGPYLDDVERVRYMLSGYNRGSSLLPTWDGTLENGRAAAGANRRSVHSQDLSNAESRLSGGCGCCRCGGR